MRLASIASGSSGNCIYIGSDHSHILIDDGISARQAVAGLNRLGLTPEDLDGILVTHEHVDHVKGLGVFSRKYEIPVYGTEGTIRRIRQDQRLGAFPADIFHEIRKEADFCLGDLVVHPFAVSHDAADPAAFRVSCGEKRTAVVTDLGEYDERIIAELQGLDALLLEANHDIRMLQVGPYPYALKERIHGRKGHICNETAGQLLGQILHDNLKGVLLGHLSKENNLPELALESVKLEITLGAAPYKGSDFPIETAPRTAPSACLSW